MHVICVSNIRNNFEPIFVDPLDRGGRRHLYASNDRCFIWDAFISHYIAVCIQFRALSIISNFASKTRYKECCCFLARLPNLTINFKICAIYVFLFCSTCVFLIGIRIRCLINCMSLFPPPRHCLDIASAGDACARRLNCAYICIRALSRWWTACESQRCRSAPFFSPRHRVDLIYHFPTFCSCFKHFARSWWPWRPVNTQHVTPAAAAVLSGLSRARFEFEFVLCIVFVFPSFILRSIRAGFRHHRWRLWTP
jgi:hypothetical protein